MDRRKSLPLLYARIFNSLLPSHPFPAPSQLSRGNIFFFWWPPPCMLREQWPGAEKTPYHSECDLLPWEKTASFADPIFTSSLAYRNTWTYWTHGCPTNSFVLMDQVAKCYCGWALAHFKRASAQAVPQIVGCQYSIVALKSDSGLGGPSLAHFDNTLHSAGV